MQRGRQPGVYTDWAVAQDQVRGYPGPRFRRFATWAEADEFVRQGQPSQQQQQQQQKEEEEETTKQAQQDQQEEEGKKEPQKQEHAAADSAEPAPREAPGMTSEKPKDESGTEYPPGKGPLPRGAFDGFDPNILLNPKTGELVYKMEQERKATKLQPKPDSEPPGMLNIYTDGSSSRNGRVGAKAGVGVYFGPGDDRYDYSFSLIYFVIANTLACPSRNVSEPLKGSRQTNQRAELTAVVRALDIAPRHRDVTIFSDSQYAINAVTVWHVNWQRNSWMTADRRPVENKDLIQSIVTRVDERKALNVATLFEWVRGHNNDQGNVAADRLAKAGADMPDNGGGSEPVNATATTISSNVADNNNNNNTSSSNNNNNNTTSSKPSPQVSPGRSSRSPNAASNEKKKLRKRQKRADKVAEAKDKVITMAKQPPQPGRSN